MLRTTLLVALCVASAFATDFRACSDGSPSPDFLEVSGCETLPCDFVHGTDLDSKVTFTASADASTLRPLVMVTTLGLTIDYPLPDQDVCANLISGGCPLAAGDQVIYNLIMPILQEYPLVSMSIEFSVLDEADNTLTCFEVDGKVVNP
ncbi:ecdysteroid-regulated 16 kDa protein [Neocloeon triangulifer]|uniref:ecdysteroid-regulated 16 kDa protein n=1 Tax=Neocloeon triangulifer TaxID=2078957 RepID=UPI00286F82EB|nr:ecdysteroid-regulated 16 kDa protein [Neocloeon triangulifer]